MSYEQQNYTSLHSILYLAVLSSVLLSTCHCFTPQFLPNRRSMVTSSNTIKNSSEQNGNNNPWTTLSPESLVSAPCLIEQTLCEVTEDDNNPQVAKDLDYAKAVLEAWKGEDEDSVWSAEMKRVTYYTVEEPNIPLFGRLVRMEGDNDSSSHRQGILLFHTGAGPQDIFLMWKAASLVNTLECTVLIADILSDGPGFCWSDDRSRFAEARDYVLKVDYDSNQRPILRQRIQAAIEVLKTQNVCDGYPIAAMGWCLGGHSILELAKMKLSNIRGLVTFHGVFDDLHPPREDAATSTVTGEEYPSGTAEALICHGIHDPYVADEALEVALKTLQICGHKTSLLQLPSKHGFTNPAQDFNDNEDFAFDKVSAEKAWHQACNLARRVLTIE